MIEATERTTQTKIVLEIDRIDCIWLEYTIEKKMTKVELSSE